MGKCLITKLSGIVEDGTLLKVGEFKIQVSKLDATPTVNTHSLSITPGEACDIYIIGNGYFTDKTFSQNLGKRYNVTEKTTLYISNGDYEIHVPKKYGITTLEFPKKGGVLSFDIGELKYINGIKIASLFGKISGDISSLSNLVNLSWLELTSSFVSGDVSSLANLANLVYLNLSSVGLEGNSSFLKGLTKVTNLTSLSNAITFNLEDLKNMTALETLWIRGAVGDIGVFSDMSQLKSLTFLNTKNTGLTGDLASISASCSYIDHIGAIGNYTWGSRSTSAKILSIKGNPFIENVDEMLINQAKCTGGSNSDKQIVVSGNKTSASDDAVSTLKSKGYTIIIKGVIL